MKFTKISALALGLFGLFASPSISHATSVSFNSDLFTIYGTDVFSGPSLTVVGNYGTSDTLDFWADGEVGLAGQAFYANAAGVVTRPGTTNTGHHPGQCAPSAGFCYAAILVGNSSLGYHQLFPADAAHGLGSSLPPTYLTVSQTLGAVFGQGLVDGTVLLFRINDINTGDNSGAFRVGTNAAVPEPTSLALLALGAPALLRRRKKVA